MEIIPTDCILEFNTDTLEYLRGQYDLDQPGRMEEAINLLDEWIQKQPHFMKKDFPRDYLERTIIITKGSVERAKTKLDKICTFRTLYPDYFGVRDVKNYKVLNDLYGGFLPKLTSDHYRVYMFKSKAKVLENGLQDFYRYFIMQCEYIQAHDYCNGLVVFLDYTEGNIMEIVKWMNVADIRQILEVIKDGYGMRIKGMHLITQSKAVEAIVLILKQALSAKLSERLFTHKNIDTVYDYVPRDIMPEDYGGKEKSLLALHKQFQEILTSKEFISYSDEMNKACTNEKLRLINDETCLGISGTFRTLNVD